MLTKKKIIAIFTANYFFEELIKLLKEEGLEIERKKNPNQLTFPISNQILLVDIDSKKRFLEIKKLLRHKKREYYIKKLREELKQTFHSDKGTDFIYHLLHDTRKNKNWFLKDYKLHSIYMNGAELYGHKIKHEYKILGWQYPIDEASAKLSQKQLKETDLKKVTQKEFKKNTFMYGFLASFREKVNAPSKRTNE